MAHCKEKLMLSLVLPWLFLPPQAPPVRPLPRPRVLVRQRPIAQKPQDRPEPVPEGARPGLTWGLRF